VVSRRVAQMATPNTSTKYNAITTQSMPVIGSSGGYGRE
jgi:hypothetical protein